MDIAAVPADVPAAPATPPPPPAPVRFTPRIDPADGLAGAPAELAATNEVLEHSLAAGTVANYRSSWADWERFCAERGWRSLPADPHQVAMYLTVVGAEVADGALARDDDGNPLPGRLRPNTVAHRLTAINKAHTVAGHALPGEDPGVVAVVRGLRRMFGSAPVLAKAALDLPLLERLLAAIDETPVETLRDLALVAVVHATSATSGQLARLEWDHVDLSAAPTVALPPTGRGRRHEPCALVARPGDPVCAVTALGRLRDAAGADGPVFTGAGTGRAFTRQGIRQALIRLTGSSAPDALALRRCAGRLIQPSLRQRRDRALLLCGWWAALRRSNLVAARWSDTAVYHGDWELRLRRTKNNVDGAKDQRSWLIAAPDGWPCPVEAMDAWRDALAATLGVAAAELQRSDLPLFVPIDRHGNVVRDGDGRPVPLSGDAVCAIVKDRAARARLDAEDFGAHSLRSGFITEALTGDKLSVAEVQGISFHEDVNVLLGYRRVANRHRDNPVRRMFDLARQGTTASGAPSPADVLRSRQIGS